MSAEPSTDMALLLLGLTLILLGGRLGGALFERFGLPAVLGELGAGVVIGNLGLIGIHALERLRDLSALHALGEIGVLFLLFRVALESDVHAMRAIWGTSLLVAVLGILVPMGLGALVSGWFFPNLDPLAHAFVGATLCATSIGVTARVLADLGRAQSREGRIILGAAVLDDVLGLLVLAVVVGIIQATDRGAPLSWLALLVVVGRALAFLAGAVWIGRWLSKKTFALATRLQGAGVLLSVALAFCFALAYAADRAGLAPIVGAFAAGIALDRVHYRDLRDRDPRRRDLVELLEPIAVFLVPIFFVVMGMRLDLRAFTGPQVMGFAAVLTVAAILGKQACSLGVLGKGADRIAVGLGMIPRGEVGLIFASIGTALTLKGQPVISPALSSAVLVMVAITTVVTPPLLAWRFRKRP